MNHSPLPVEVWTTRAAKHTTLVSAFADAFVQRRNSRQTHAVHDFLFTYYSFSPSKLKRWVPSYEENLNITTELLQQYSWLNDYWFKLEGNVLLSNRDRLHEGTRYLAQFIADLCDNILNRAPRFRCFGLHEWAMVYKLSPEAIRHKRHRLRLPPEELSAFVESQTICCSHYDAYRFFTKEAHPLNTLSPSLDKRLEMEQGGCVHANMDLYKWSAKLWPWIGSDFIAKTFFHALQCRELDMRASPYDLINEGYLPIYIETEQGRKQYQNEQQQLTEQAAPLRRELSAFCKRLISFIDDQK